MPRVPGTPRGVIMAKKPLPAPSCPIGYTREDLLAMFGTVGIDDFDQWMRGQTQAICEGRRYNHDKKAYEPDACEHTPHGVVAYTWDVERYIDHLPPLD